MKGGLNSTVQANGAKDTSERSGNRSRLKRPGTGIKAVGKWEYQLSVAQ